jgi:hypothetical protein
VYLHPADALATTRRGQEIFLAHTWAQERQTLVHLVAALLKNGKPQ